MFQKGRVSSWISHDLLVDMEQGPAAVVVANRDLVQGGNRKQVKRAAVFGFVRRAQGSRDRSAKRLDLKDLADKPPAVKQTACDQRNYWKSKSFPKPKAAPTKAKTWATPTAEWD